MLSRDEVKQFAAWAGYPYSTPRRWLRENHYPTPALRLIEAWRADLEQICADSRRQAEIDAWDTIILLLSSMNLTDDGTTIAAIEISNAGRLS
jgi:hypothetical protein